ncbi:hypothetical protein [Kribbella italica]|uniref:Uncharacterized protein n=1 Tax=Kribbella italica TaxID=1540520 RepID=A0A7W9J524_9ACTN|nr:hypothetical protein [Kribbella italica]MBB5835520.1 hypothetical protein [Kribbella italica]
MLIANLVWAVGLIGVLLGLVATLRYRLVAGTFLIVFGFAIGITGVEVVAG